MRSVLYGLLFYVLIMVSVLSAGEREKIKGGSAQLPRRSISRGSGLVPSVSHGNLQEALLAKAARLRVGDEDLEDEFGTGDSSRAESLTSLQQSDHEINFDVEALRAQSLPRSQTTVVVKKTMITTDLEKSLTDDIAMLEPFLKKFFATLPSERRGLQDALVTKYLLNLLQEKNNTLTQTTLSAEIRKIRQKQGRGCCVIL